MAHLEGADTCTSPGQSPRPSPPDSEQDQVNSRYSVKCVEEIVASKIGFSCLEPHLFCSVLTATCTLQPSFVLSPPGLSASSSLCHVLLGKSEALPVSIKEKMEGVSVLIPSQSGRHPHCETPPVFLPLFHTVSRAPPTGWHCIYSFVLFSAPAPTVVLATQDNFAAGN